MIRKLALLCLGVLVVLPIAYGSSFDNMKASFLSGDYKAAIAEGEKAMSVSSVSSSGLDELYYFLGLSYLKDGNYLRASDIFEIIIKEFKSSPFSEEARLGLADTYFLRQDLAKAEEHYLELADDPSMSSLKPQVYYRLSQIGFKKGDAAKAKGYLQDIKEDFPLSPEARLEAGIYSGADIYYTVQVGSFLNGANARKLTQKLLDKGYSAYTEESASQGKTIYRVRVGRLSTRQEAVSLEAKLSEEGYSTKIFP